MARKVANGVNKKQTRRRSENLETGSDFDSSTDSNFSTGMSSRGSDYKNLIREFISNPAVKYMAGGIATAVLSRLATNMSEKYPELSRFLKENINSFEGRLDQYRPGFSGDDRESRA